MEEDEAEGEGRAVPAGRAGEPRERAGAAGARAGAVGGEGEGALGEGYAMRCDYRGYALSG